MLLLLLILLMMIDVAADVADVADVVFFADNDLCLPQLLAVPLQQARVGVRCSCYHRTAGEICSLILIMF